MTRIDALRAVYDRLERCAVVTIMGAVAAELQSIGHRPNFFYLQHAMGLASSVGLGIALSRPAVPVVVFDGDGSLLMNLGGLTTLGALSPGNLVHVVFDNESLLSVGGFPTATSTGSDLAAIAAAAGVPRTACVNASTSSSGVRRRAARAGADDDRREGRGGRARRHSSPISGCSKTASSFSATCRRANGTESDVDLSLPHSSPSSTPAASRSSISRSRSGRTRRSSACRTMFAPRRASRSR